MKKRALIFVILAFLGIFLLLRIAKTYNLNPSHYVGEPLDSLNHVVVYYNGGVNHVSERNTVDEYNIGLKYQCVEFVKRYYFEHLNHRMPDSYGHAKTFFATGVKDGGMNEQRNLRQFTNPSGSRPAVDDLMVMKGSLLNRYGHVAIVSKVTDTEIELVQQNPGPFSSSRVTLGLVQEAGKWRVDKMRVVGWLRK